VLNLFRKEGGERDFLRDVKRIYDERGTRSALRKRAPGGKLTSLTGKNKRTLNENDRDSETGTLLHWILEEENNLRARKRASNKYLLKREGLEGRLTSAKPVL